MATQRVTKHLVGGGLIATLLLQFSSFAARGTDDCPGADPDRLDSYDFTIAADSLVRPSSDGTSYRFIRCVVNEDFSGSMVYIDWPLASIKGWIREGDPLIQSYGSNTHEADTVRSILYLGITRESMWANLRRSKEELPAFRPVFDTLRTLVNEFITVIPMDIDYPDETAQAAHLVVTSEVERLQDMYRYTYTWQNLYEGSPLEFLWHSETMNSLMVEPADTFTAVDEVQEYSFEDNGRPAYGLTLVEFLDEVRRPTASAPVAIYHPETRKP